MTRFKAPKDAYKDAIVDDDPQGRGMDERKGCVVSCNEDQDKWHIDCRQIKGDVKHRKIVAPHEDTAEDVTEGMICVLDALR